MGVFRITGGVPLSGQVRVSGSKNAALPIMAASILADGPVDLLNVPRLKDVTTLARVLRELGIRVSRPTAKRLRLETIDHAAVKAGYRHVRRMRASFCVLGPLLARRGRAVVPLPGGCNIGDRPVDLHLAGLTALGADVRVSGGYVIAESRRLRAASIDMTGPYGPSVTGTANVLSAATLARGTTTIHGAAREPEIVDLGRFLNSLGARISGLGSTTIQIEGVTRLGGGTHRIIPDRIEAATLLLAALATGGWATVQGVRQEFLSSVLEVLNAMGASWEHTADTVTVRSNGRVRPTKICATPYPGIPTDVQAQLMTLASLAAGTSEVSDAVFPERFGHVPELNRLGASIRRHGSRAVVHGVTRLVGTAVRACDLRASAALVIAGLAAEGVTLVERIGHLDRGYEHLERKLRKLGACIARLQASGLRPQEDRCQPFPEA